MTQTVVVGEKRLNVCPVNQWELYHPRGGKGGLPYEVSFATRQLEASRYKLQRKEENKLLKPRRMEPTRQKWTAVHERMAMLARGGDYGYGVPPPTGYGDTTNAVFAKTLHLDNTRPERKEKVKVAMPKAHRHVREFLDASLTGKYNGSVLPRRPQTAPIRGRAAGGASVTFNTSSTASTAGTDDLLNATTYTVVTEDPSGLGDANGQFGAGWRHIPPTDPIDNTKNMTAADIDPYVPPYIKNPKRTPPKRAPIAYRSPIFKITLRERNTQPEVKNIRSWQEATKGLSLLQFSSYMKEAHPTPHINRMDMPSAGVKLAFPERQDP